MDEKTVRAQLSEVRADLDRNAEEREILLSLHRGLEGWLRLHGATEAPPTVIATTPSPEVPQPLGAERTGDPSFRDTILRVIRDARGEPVHSKEILLRVRELGADTRAKDPAGIVDLVAYGLKKEGKPIDKIRPRTWVWTGAEGHDAPLFRGTVEAASNGRTHE